MVGWMCLIGWTNKTLYGNVKLPIAIMVPWYKNCKILKLRKYFLLCPKATEYWPFLKKKAVREIMHFHLHHPILLEIVVTPYLNKTLQRMPSLISLYSLSTS